MSNVSNIPLGKKGDGQKLHKASSKGKICQHQLYGNSHTVIALYHKETKQWPQIRPGDAEAYRRFENLIVNDPVFSKETVEQYICM